MKTYCIFAAQYFPHLGGVERYTYNLAKNLRDRGNKVVIVTSNVYRLASCEKKEGILIYRVPCINVLNGRYPVLKPNAQFLKIHKQLRKYHFDLIIVNTRFYLHSLYGMFLAKIDKTQCITLDHGTSHLSVHNKIWDFVGSVYEHFITKIGQLFCKNYYGVSAACNDWLKHFHIKAKGILYNSIDLKEVEEIRSRNVYSYRKQFQIPDDAIVVTFTGRLLEEKGILNLMKVIIKLQKDMDNLYLFIAGDGDLEKEIDSKKTDHIIPLGRIDYEQIIALLDDSDIFCLPSFSEGFSTSILEAAACWCYVLTTARGGARELLIDDNYGSVVSNNSEPILYKELKDVIVDKNRRERGCELTYERVKTHFTWDIVADQIESM